MVKRASRPIAGGLHLIGGDCLYGRYWVPSNTIPCLHFEVCYYQAIEFAIETQARPRGSRRAGRTQARPRLPADQHVFGALHSRSQACAAPSPTISNANAPTSMPPAKSSPSTHPSAKVRYRAGPKACALGHQIGSQCPKPLQLGAPKPCTHPTISKIKTAAAISVSLNRSPPRDASSVMSQCPPSKRRTVGKAQTRSFANLRSHASRACYRSKRLAFAKGAKSSRPEVSDR